jgi:hypothetical protein
MVSGIPDICLIILAALAIGLPVAAAAGADDLSAGIAVVDITPPLGYRMAGYFSERLNTGTHDPLRAKAIVFRQGGERAALVFCDILGVPLEVSSEARKRAEAATGIPAANILIAATHSHTGPLYFGSMRKYFHDRAVAQGGSDPCERVDYAADLAANIVKAVRDADAAARPASLAVAAAEQPNLAFNRRFHMKDGSVRFNPGVLNPDIVRAAGPVDPQVRAVFVRGVAGDRPALAIVNFALHLDTTGGTEYSADYPFYLERSLRASLGEKFTLLFGTGTCGDINHVDVTRKERPKAEEIGSRLAATVLAATQKPVARPSLAVRREIVSVPLQRYTAEQLAQAREDMKKVGTPALPFLKQVEACKIVALEMRGGETAPMEVQVFRLAPDVAVVGLPGEVFVDLGLAIRQASPFPITLVIELCNDSSGYIPTRKAFAEGSYETVNSIIAPGGGEMLAETAARLLKDLALQP